MSRLKGAEDLFADFHEKEPRNYDIVKVVIPDTVHYDGVADHIVYRSGKWLPGNKKQDFIHTFDSFPDVFFEDGEGRARSVQGLIGRLDEQIPLTLLGTCLEFKYRRGGKNGEIVEWFFNTNSPKLLCTPNRKTLVVLDAEGPFFISGAKMRVEARGIVQ